jgi:hypothetical protein
MKANIQPNSLELRLSLQPASCKQDLGALLRVGLESTRDPRGRPWDTNRATLHVPVFAPTNIFSSCHKHQGFLFLSLLFSVGPKRS